MRLLAHVLANAAPGDAESVCDAIERFGEDVLTAENKWLKIAGRTKADVLKVAVEQAPDRGSILEMGTYCGYSALRMSLARPDTRIVTLEVDPVDMIIARNVVAYAGLAHNIDVWMGHSKDVLHRLPARYNDGPPLSFCVVFMDQKGSRYDDDLAILESMDLLRLGAVVVADNVLKPGAPFFLWRLSKSGAYDTQIVTLQEFAMASEDWMSVSVRRDNREVVVPEHPPGLVQLHWESDRIRSLATQAEVRYGQWSDFADHMKEEFCKFGIAATVDGNDLEPLRQSLRDSVASFARADSDVTPEQKTKEVLN
jgi:catechol O-methyltransferase